jgi:DNA-binding winged helix-turn-helix (wHTH) protein/tetratricopeptide (TPR) repeat protein
MFVFGSFRFDVANASLKRGKQSILLTPKALNVLHYLVEHAGQLVTKDDLWRAVWPRISVTDATLTMCVSELRKALRDPSNTPRYIETVHRLGYRFIAPVSTEPDRFSNSAVPRQELERAPGLLSPSSHFVGRQPELAELHKWLELASKGDRQIVFVTGEPGIGKTTLVEEFLRQEQVVRNGLWLGRGQCVEHYGTGEAYLPVLDALGRLCREPGGGRLVELLDRYAPGWLLQMPALISKAERRECERRVAGMTQMLMLRQLTEAIEAISRERALILGFEDLHWSDYSTIEWLGFLARGRETARLLVLGTYRSVEVIVREHPLKNLKHELQVHGQCKELPLALLSEAAVREYLTLRYPSTSHLILSSEKHWSKVSASHALPDLAHTIYERTDGNPLFMVNMADYLLERGIVRTVEDMKATGSLDAFAAINLDVPPTIVGMVERNLERLDPGEQLALEAASVAGVAKFTTAAVAMAVDRPIREIESCCTRLARRQLFVQSIGTEEWPDGTVAGSFQFLHGLYRAVLYDRVPPAIRLDFHHRIAESEETAWGERAHEIAAELAHHYKRANDRQKAIHYLALAGEQAIQRSAHADAIGSLTAAVELLRNLPDNTERMQTELPLQILLGGALTAIKGFASPDVKRTYTRAHDLCQGLGKAAHLPALFGLWVYYLASGELDVARELAERECVALAETARDPALLLPSHHALGVTLFHLGDFSKALMHIDQSLSICDVTAHRRLRDSSFYIQDWGTMGGAHAALALWHLGFPDQALNRLNETLNLAHQLQHPLSSAFTAVFGAWLHQARGEVQAVRKHSETARAIAVQYDFPLASGMAMILFGWALAEEGHPDKAIEEIRQGREICETCGTILIRPYFLILFAEACRRGRRMDGGNEALAEAMTCIKNNNERSCEADVLRLQAEFLLVGGADGGSEAEQLLRSAITSARLQNAKSLELRATSTLARLLGAQGRRDEARVILAQIYNWFTEGFSTLALQEARSLLGQLG